MPDKLADLYAQAMQTVQEHSARDNLLNTLEDYYFLSGTKDPEAGADDESTQIVRGPHVSNAANLIQDLLAYAGLTIAVPARSDDPSHKLTADAAEKFLHATLAANERQQQQDLVALATWTASVKGAACGRVLFLEDRADDPNVRTPFLIQMRDPSHVYPQFQADGVAHVVERWQRTVADIRRTWGDDILPGRDPGDLVYWTEIWTPTEFAYWADGQPVEKATQGGKRQGPWPHRYGRIPYAYAFTRQTIKQEPDLRTRPIFAGLEAEIDRMDLYDSIEATVAQEYVGDALLVTTSRDLVVDLRPLAQNQLRPGEAVEWLRAGRTPPALEASRERHSDHFERGTFSKLMYGGDPGFQLSGYAMNVLSQGAQVRLRPIIRGVQSCFADLFSVVLSIAENRVADIVTAYTVEDDDDQRPVRRAIDLDARDLDGYHEVEVKIGDIMPTDRMAKLSYGLKARTAGPDGRPFLSWETALGDLVASPAEERTRIDRELAEAHPEIQALRLALQLDDLRRHYAEALVDRGIDPAQALADAALIPQPAAGDQPPAGFAPEHLAADYQVGADEPLPVEGDDVEWIANQR